MIHSKLSWLKLVLIKVSQLNKTIYIIEFFRLNVAIELVLIDFNQLNLFETGYECGIL